MKTLALKLLRPALTALLLGATLVPVLSPGTAHAYRVFYGYGYGYGYPYYYRPPIVVAPPPVYYAPPPVYYAPPPAYVPAPAYVAPRPYASGALSYRCNAGAAICPLQTAAPVGNSCSCPSGNGRLNGRVG